MKQVLTSLIVLLFTTAATAQEASTKKELPFEVTGAVDAYYQYNFNGVAPGLTAFTPDHNSFSLGMAKVGISREGKVGFGVDVAFGPRADVANGYAGTTFGPIQQLYISYSPTDKLTFTAGNFGTHVGYELIDAKDNFHYSTSYMFSYGPFYHTGLKADYQVNDKLGLMVGIFNDTDNKFDVVDGKHFGAQISYGDVFLNYLTGTDGADSTSFNQVDLTAAFDLSDKFSLGVNATSKMINDERETEDVSWYGAALYLGYQAKENVGLGLRAEYFSDADAAIFGTPDLSIVEVTLSANIVIDRLTLIPEFRIDSASSEFFTDANGNATNASPRVVFAAVYAF